MKCSRIILFLLVTLLVFGLCEQSAQAYPVSIAEAVDNTDLRWYYYGAESWFGQTTISYYGGDAAQSGDIGHNQVSVVYTYVTGPGTLSFVWSISSEANPNTGAVYDDLHFIIDGTSMARIGGEVSWQYRSFHISSGYHELSWLYEKSPSDDYPVGYDAGWLDMVQYSSVTVTAPNGGEKWIRGTTHTIKWTSTGLSAATPLTIELMKGGVLNKVIVSATANDGSYSWYIPSTQTLGTDYKIRITKTSDPAIAEDSSDSNFAIVAGTLTVTSPNGGQKWVRGTTHAITWSSSGSPGSYVKIELMKGGVLNRVITSSTANDGSYSWTISSTQTLGTDYKIRITSTSYSLISDSSNSNFAIVRGTLTVTSPNGGESWKHGTTHTITWSKSGSTGSYVKIELLKGGVVNRVITSSTANDGSYSWTIPSSQTAGTTYKIRITSTAYSSISDSSNSNFYIIT